MIYPVYGRRITGEVILCAGIAGEHFDSDIALVKEFTENLYATGNYENFLIKMGECGEYIDILAFDGKNWTEC